MVECNKNMIMLCGGDGFSKVPLPKSEIKVILNKRKSKQSINYNICNIGKGTEFSLLFFGIVYNYYLMECL